MMDINPFNDGHCLVITKAHSVNIQDAEGEDLAAVLPTVQKIARVLNNALYPEGINIIQANGRAAGQTMFHYHSHNPSPPPDRRRADRLGPLAR